MSEQATVGAVADTTKIALAFCLILAIDLCRIFNQTETISVRSFAKDTADRCGITDRTVRLAMSIAKGLAPEVRARIAGTALARKQSELLALIKLEPDERRDVLDLLLAVPEPAARNVAEAVKIVRDVPEVERSETEAAFQKLLKVWGQAKIPARRQFLKHLMEAGDMGALLGAVTADGGKEIA